MIDLNVNKNLCFVLIWPHEHEAIREETFVSI